MSPTSDLLNGVAQMLATAGVATYHADGSPYASTDTAVWFKDLPPTPDRAVVISPWGYGDDQPVITYGRRMLQLKFRGTSDPTDVDSLADAAFAALHGATNLTFGTLHVVQILRVNSIPLGMDEQSRRWMRSDNYALDVDDPVSAYRPS